jgi:chemotaxis protein MotA
MFVIIGAAIVLGTVVGGYLIEGGHIQILIQPIELLIIGGAALGGLIISAPPAVLKDMIKQVLGTLKGASVTREHYTEALMLLFELCKNAKANPLSIEAHVEKPHESEIFKRYPKVLANHHALDFLCDSLKVQISSPMSPFDFEDLMDKDINSAHQQEHKAPAAVARVGDAMPGLGIVAAVLGVVLTMGRLTQGKEVIGHSVASALVGTFIGILASYGFLQPLSAKMEDTLGADGKFMEVLKVGLLAFAKNCSPKVCVEFSRRTIPPELRPTFTEVDQLTSGVGKKAAA